MVAPKREKMACQRSMTQKKEGEKGVTMSQKKEIGMTRERKPLPQGVSQIYPSIHPSTHTLAPLIEIT